MSDQKLNVAPKTRRTLASARSRASPQPRTFKCLKKTLEANSVEVEVEEDGEVDGEVFNEEVDENAETLPLPGLSEDLSKLNIETPNCFDFDPENRGLARQRQNV